MGKYLERDQYKAGTSRATFASANAEVFRLISNLNGLRERYKRGEANRKDAIDRGCGRRGTGELRTTLIGVWGKLEYGGKRWYDQSHMRSTAAEYEGRWARALDKRCQLAEARADKAEREEQGLRSNLKLRAEVEGGGVWKLASVRHRGREGGGHTRHSNDGVGLTGVVVLVQCHRTMNGGNGYTYVFTLIIPPGVGTTFYQGVIIRGTGGKTERGVGIN